MNHLTPGKDNKEERMNFVIYWADFVRSHADEVWSKQQNMLINAMMHNTKNYPLSPKEYLALKGEPCARK